MRVCKLVAGSLPFLLKAVHRPLSPDKEIRPMTADQAREDEAYTLGVQTVLRGMQWVKPGQTLRPRCP